MTRDAASSGCPTSSATCAPPSAGSSGCPNAPAPDLDKMRGVHELEAEHARRLAAWPAGRPVPAALRDVPWLLEELRVSHFAQALGTRGQVSAKRIRKLLDEAR